MVDLRLIGGTQTKPDRNPVDGHQDINTARYVIRMNKSGLGFSSNGYNGPYAAAITIDGTISADFIQTGTMLADRIKAGTLTSLSGGIQINLNDDTVTIDKTGSKTKTVLDETGMEVQDKSGSAAEILLRAGIDSTTGESVVQTKNLTVSKYLIIGNNSRFEDYGDGTGCFYIGG